MNNGTTILSDFLHRLQVPYTGAYTDTQFRSLSFKSLFGFSRLLARYNVESEGLMLSDKSKLTEIATPFLAHTPQGFVIVTSITDGDAGSPAEVNYVFYHREYSEAFDRFESRFDGVVLRAFPSAQSREPDYGQHHFLEVAAVVKKWLLAICTIFLLAAGVYFSGQWQHVSTILLILFTLAGVVVSFMLIQKSAHIHNHAADKMCGILVEHGCDTVLKQKASSFFGLFGWSEVGMAYFSVTLAILLLFPEQTHYLGLVNACCVPFSFWSVWYQKYRAKSWCTLCLTVQALLWCQFFCCLPLKWWDDIFPLQFSLLAIGAAYVAVLLGLNRIMPFFEQPERK